MTPVPATGATITTNLPSPQLPGTPVVFTAAGAGSTSPYDYQFWLLSGTTWTMVQAYGNGASWTLPGTTPAGNYTVAVEVRTSPLVPRDAYGTNLAFKVGWTPATGATITPSLPSPQPVGTAITFTAAGAGSTNAYDYQFWLNNGTAWTMVQAYGNGAAYTLPSYMPPGTYSIAVEVRTSPLVARDAYGTNVDNYVISSLKATGATITASAASPQPSGTPVTFTAAGKGSTLPYDYQFWLYNGSTWTMVQAYGNGASWVMPGTTPAGTYSIAVEVRTSPTVARDAYGTNLDGYRISSNIAPATGADITASLASPQNAGTAVTFTAAGTGSVGPYDYQFWLWNGATWTMVQAYGNGASWTMPGTQPIGTYSIAVEVRTSPTVARDAYGRNLDGYQIR